MQPVERLPYDEMIVILEPAYVLLTNTVWDPVKREKRWIHERETILERHGWTVDAFYRVLDARIRDAFHAYDHTTLPISRVTCQTGPKKPTQEVMSPPESGLHVLKACQYPYELKGSELTYESRNRIHIFSRWNEVGGSVTVLVSCSDATTGREYWAEEIEISPTTRVVDAVRSARKKKYGNK